MATATWGRILQELTRLQLQDQKNPPQLGQPSKADGYRRSKIKAVEDVTKRPLIIYGSACTTSGKGNLGPMLMLDYSDKIGFKTVTDNIPPPNLDVLIHSPGGYAEAVESLVQQLRGKYTNINFIIPSYAKSAATMLAISGDAILMDEDAELGPIDPQMRTQNGSSPAEAIKEQFQKAQEELKADQTKLPSWFPILSQLGPSLLVECEHAIDLSKTLVKDWLIKYMFRNDVQAVIKATLISNWLSNHAEFKSHGRAIKIPDLEQHHVNVVNIRTESCLYLAIDELYCCLDIFFSNSPVFKIFENSSGDALIRNQQTGLIPMPQVQPTPPSPRKK